MVKTYTFFGILIGTIGVFSLLVYHSVISVSSAQPIPPDAIPGKAIFQKKACIECHTIFGNGGYLGGDLTKIHGRSGEKVLKDFLVNPPILPGAKRKRHDQVNEQEAEAIIAYLRYLNSINTLDWPLDPNNR